MRTIIGFCLILLTFAAHADETSTYASNLKLRDDRKVGVGAEFGGQAGLFGALLELNVVDEDATVAGVGFGNTYSTFSLGWKHSFEGRMFTPYTTLGWSHWYSDGGSAPKSHILDEMLTSSEKSEGRFGMDLVMAGLGGQYQELDGDFAGTSWFGEVNMAISPMRGKIMPTAAVGGMYYF